MTNFQKIEIVNVFINFLTHQDIKKMITELKNIFDKFENSDLNGRYNDFYNMFSIDYIIQLFDKTEFPAEVVFKDKLNEFFTLWKEIFDKNINKDFYSYYTSLFFIGRKSGYELVDSEGYYTILENMISSFNDNQYMLNKEMMNEPLIAKIREFVVDKNIDINLINKLINRFNELNNEGGK